MRRARSPRGVASRLAHGGRHELAMRRPSVRSKLMATNWLPQTFKFNTMVLTPRGECAPLCCRGNEWKCQRNLSESYLNAVENTRVISQMRLFLVEVNQCLHQAILKADIPERRPRQLLALPCAPYMQNPS